MPAAIRDVMPAFELFQPTSVADTLGRLERHGGDAWVMAGGLDTFDWLKDRIRKPRVVVDLSAVAELRGIKDAGGGRPVSDDVIVDCGSRDFWDFIGGVGANGYFWRINYDGRLPGNQNVYPPPRSALGYLGR